MGANSALLSFHPPIDHPDPVTATVPVHSIVTNPVKIRHLHVDDEKFVAFAATHADEMSRHPVSYATGRHVLAVFCHLHAPWGPSVDRNSHPTGALVTAVAIVVTIDEDASGRPAATIR